MNAKIIPLALFAIVVAPLLSSIATASSEGLAIDCQFPGGNILVDKVDADHVYLHQDPRDTEGFWFYWNFRVRGTAGEQRADCADRRPFRRDRNPYPRVQQDPPRHSHQATSLPRPTQPAVWPGLEHGARPKTLPPLGFPAAWHSPGNESGNTLCRGGWRAGDRGECPSVWTRFGADNPPVLGNTAEVTSGLNRCQ